MATKMIWYAEPSGPVVGGVLYPALALYPSISLYPES